MQSSPQVSQSCTVPIDLGVISWKLAPEFVRAFHLFLKCILTGTERVEMYQRMSSDHTPCSMGLLGPRGHCQL